MNDPLAVTDPRAAEPGRRERKKAELRRALERAALRLAGEHGYEHLTAEAIAEACDVSTRTFFNYFSSKDEALLGPLLDRKRQMRAAFDARPASETVIESLRAASIELAGDLLADQGEWKMRRQVFDQNPVLRPRANAAFAELERSLTDAVAVRLGLDPRTDPYPALVVALAITAVRVAAMHSMATGAPGQDLPELVARMFDTTFSKNLEN
jgi:AcrR family transcriptional regulator